MKHLMIFIFLALATQASWAQASKAEKYYKDHRYGEAIPLFIKAIQKDDSAKLKSKLATCYFKTNQLQKAAQLYEELVLKRKVQSINYLRYGEVLMAFGKYDEAKSYFLKYAEERPQDDKGMIMAETCDYVKTIKPFFHHITFLDFHYNSDADDSDPFIYMHNLYFASDRKPAYKLLQKKAGWTGRDFVQLYQVDWDSDPQFAQVTPLPQRINNLNKNMGKPSFTKNGELFFSRNSSYLAKDNTFKVHLFHARMQPDGSFSKPEKLSFCNQDANYLHPTISHDGKQLFYASNRRGGEGGMDIYFSERSYGGWGRPMNLGEVVNSYGHDAFPFIHPSGKLFFSSKGHKGFGGFDVFMTWRDSLGVWQEPINVGAPVNSGGDDVGFFLDSLGITMAFSSSRNGDNDDVFIAKLDTLEEMKTLSSMTNPADTKENPLAAVNPSDLEFIDSDNDLLTIDSTPTAKKKPTPIETP